MYVPPVAYVCEGFARVDVATSPNDQRRVAIAPSESVEVSVKVQTRSVQLLVNDATGAAFDGGEAAQA